jgi:hypothetical protein
VSGVAHLTAYSGVTAWSHAVGDQTRISYRRNGVVRDLPGSLPDADPDLGPSRDARSVVLVVSRCGGDGCRVTSTDTRTGRTVQVHGLGGLRLYVRDRAGRTRRLLRLLSGSFSETDVDRTHAVVTDSGDSSVRIVGLRTGRSRVVWQGEESASFSDAPYMPALDRRLVVWLERSSGIGLQFRQWLGAGPATIHPSKACGRRELPAADLAITPAGGRLLYATADAVPQDSLWVGSGGVAFRSGACSLRRVVCRL